MSAIGRRTALKVLAGGAAAAGAAAALPRPAEAATPPTYPEAEGLLYDSVRCIGCRACVTWCKKANELPDDRVILNGVPYDAPQDLSATTKNIIRLAVDGDRSAFVKGGCMQCLRPACVNSCMVSALTKDRVTGVIAYDPDLCVGDRYCQVACPFNVPKYQWSNALTPRIVKCELCRHRKEGPACAEVCPRQAIVRGKVVALKAEAHRRIAATPKAYHAKVYGEHEAGGTQVLTLAPAEMPPVKLGLPELDDTPVPALSEAIHGGVYKAGIAPIALYAAFAFVTWRNRKRGDAGREERP